MIKLIDVHLMCAMAPPYRGGRDVTPRFKRHFVVLTISEFEDEVMTMIFSKIVLWHLDTRFVQIFHMCVCVCVCVCVCEYTYVCIYVYIYFTHITYIHVCVFTV